MTWRLHQVRLAQRIAQQSDLTVVAPKGGESKAWSEIDGSLLPTRAERAR